VTNSTTGPNLLQQPVETREYLVQQAFELRGGVGGKPPE